MTRTPENRSDLPFDPTRKTALAVGILYLLTFIGSIPGALLMAPVLTNPNYIAGPGAATQIGIAAVCEMVNVLALIGCAVAAFSIVKRQHEGLALGYVATRSFEAAVIVIGIVSILAVSSLQQTAAAGGDAAAFVPVGIALVDVRHWTMVIGPSMAAFNALMFGTLLYRSRLVPRAIPALGLVGAPLLISWAAGAMIGITEPNTAWHSIAVFPFFFWELAVGLWLTFKGFNRDAPIVVAAMAEVNGPTAPWRRWRRRRSASRPRLVRHDGAEQQELRTPPRPLIRTFWMLHRAAYRLTGGRFGLSQPEAGAKFGFMRVTTVGRRSGKARVAMLGYFEDGPNLVTLAMNGWADAEPAWWLNLQETPGRDRRARRRPTRGASSRRDRRRSGRGCGRGSATTRAGARTSIGSPPAERTRPRSSSSSPRRPAKVGGHEAAAHAQTDMASPVARSRPGRSRSTRTVSRASTGSAWLRS